MSRRTIRPAQPADVPTIHALIRELAAYERMSDQVVATDELLHAALFGPRSHVECPLAEVEADASTDEGARAVVGFALFFHNFSTFLARSGIYLEDLYVRPEYRGAGIGKALLAHLAGLAVERGCGRLEWWVLDWNEPAIRFYRALGAQAMDEWTVFRVTGEALARLASAAVD